ncbi:MAG: diversity-generating retroelement protein Avd [Saprospiraceae bacterium]
MDSDKNTIVQKSYDLLKETVLTANGFPRSQKFTLGDRLQNQATDLMDNYIRALYAPREAKRALLDEANIQLEILRHYYRLAYDLGLYNSVRYKHFAEIIQHIGRMTGGWIKSLGK